MEKFLLSGNEAIARGAYEAGVKVGTGYPGTPSTEILENFESYPDVYAEWSVNEKVAFEVGFGSSLAGVRTLITMKHVGVNVAADPLFTSSYIGVKGGCVLAVADDPNMHSSQNEQDTRHYARAAKLPAIEPSNSQEAKDFVRVAFDMSEQFDIPVILRSTTRLSHGRSIVTTSEPVQSPVVPGFEKDPKKFVMIPAYARAAHVKLEKKLDALREFAESSELNREEMGNTDMGIITSGIAYTYVKEAFPEASVLKLGMVFPLPEKKIRAFAAKVKKLYIVEELEPFFENQLLAWGIPVVGKALLPIVGEFEPAMLRAALGAPVTDKQLVSTDIKVPPRPPALCPGCPHQQIFTSLNKLGVTVTGDIGCYTLGVLPPYSAMDTCVDMGASLGVSQGIEIAESMSGLPKRKLAAVIGDSTFAHSGLTGLVNAAYNKRNSLIIVLDNGTTAMTGMQPNPFSGETLQGASTYQLDYEKLAESVGIDPANYKKVNAYKLDDIEKTLSEMVASDALSLLVVEGTCVIFKRRQAKKLQQQISN